MFNPAEFENISLEDLDKEIASRKGLKGVVSDIESTITEFPGALKSFATELPGEALASGKQLFQQPGRFAKNILAGIGGGITSPALLPEVASKYAAEKGFIEPQTAQTISEYTPHIGERLKQMLGLQEQQPGDVLLQQLTGFAASPFKFASRGAGALGRTGALSGYAATQEQNPLEAALMGGLFEGVGQAATKIPGLAPSRMLAPNIPMERLQQNLEAARGTETNLGRVIENPSLARTYENQLFNQKFSGVPAQLQKVGQQVQTKAQDLMSKIRGDVEFNSAGDYLLQGIKTAEKDVQKQKDALFKKYNDLVEKQGVTTNRQNLRDRAQDILDKIEQDPDLAAFRDPGDLKLLERITKPSEKNEFSIKETDYLLSELGKLSSDAFRKGDSVKAGIYGDLRNALEDDIEQATDNEDIHKARTEARDFYRREVVPFMDKDITKFTRGNADPDTLLPFFVRRNQLHERPNLARKLMSKMDENGQRVVQYTWLSSAFNEDGTINPSKLRNLWTKLGPQQKEAIFPNKLIRKEFDNFARLVEMNPQAMQVMFNPPTGQKLADILSSLKGSGIAATAGGALFGPPGAAIGALTGSAIPGLASRLITKPLTSEQTRTKLVGKIIKEAKRAASEEKTKGQNYAEKLSKVLKKSAPMELILTKNINE
jgi:hypothetical protein